MDEVITRSLTQSRGKVLKSEGGRGGHLVIQGILKYIILLICLLKSAGAIAILIPLSDVPVSSSYSLD